VGKCIGWLDSSSDCGKPTCVAALEALTQKFHDEPSCFFKGLLNPPICIDHGCPFGAKCELAIAFPLAPQLSRRNFTFARENHLFPSVQNEKKQIRRRNESTEELRQPDRSAVAVADGIDEQIMVVTIENN